MATSRFLIVGKYAVGSNRGLHDIDLVDTRVRGGGIKEELVTDFKGSYPQVRWFHDIGHYDGTPFPGATAVLVDLPATLLEVNGGIFNKKQIDSIVKHHLSFGIYPVIRFYCTNTGLVKHEDVSDSTVFLGTWDVPDGETCPDEDGTVLCTLVTATTTTTIPFGYRILDYLGSYDNDNFYLRSLTSEYSWNSYFIAFDDPVNGAEKVQLEIRTRHDTELPRWWTNPEGVTPDIGGESIEGTSIGDWNDVLGTAWVGPWDAAELANLQLFMEESTGAEVMDLGGMRFHLLDASDVVIETIYPNYIYNNLNNAIRMEPLTTAPSGFQWVERTDNTYWTGNGQCVWNAGGWWDITSGPPVQLAALGGWNTGLEPLAFRFTHDDVATGQVTGADSTIIYGRRNNYASGTIVDLAAVEGWAQDFRRIDWTSQPNGAKITKIEVLEPI